MANLISLQKLAKLIDYDVLELNKFTNAKNYKEPLPANSKKEIDFVEAVVWIIKHQKKEIDDFYNFKVTRKQLANLFGYKNEKYINELERDFGLEKEGWNKYDLKKSIEWFLKYKEEIHQKELNKIKADKPQDDLARKQAILKQMDIDEREGRLIDSDIVRSKWLDEVNVFVLNIESIEAQLIMKLKQLLKDNRKGKKIIKDVIRKIREKIANTKLDI